MSLAHGRRAVSILSLLAASLVACTPALDWREVRPEGTGLSALFPCRPDRHERDVRLADMPARMQLHACDAAGATFSLAVVDAAMPSRVEPVLAALKASAAANIGGAAPRIEPFAPPGATPNPGSALLHVAGRLPDGRAVTMHAAFFVHGLRVFQATAVGAALADETLQSFFGATRLAP